MRQKQQNKSHPETVAGAGKGQYFLLVVNFMGLVQVQRSCASLALFCYLRKGKRGKDREKER